MIFGDNLTFLSWPKISVWMFSWKHWSSVQKHDSRFNGSSSGVILSGVGGGSVQLWHADTQTAGRLGPVWKIFGTAQRGGVLQGAGERWWCSVAQKPLQSFSVFHFQCWQRINIHLLLKSIHICELCVARKSFHWMSFTCYKAVKTINMLKMFMNRDTQVCW